jgi:hypothetical protein
MTCWVCHGGRNPSDGAVVPGLAGFAFDYGLVLATSRLLDPRNEAAVAYRRARGFVEGRRVQARLLMAGPGRQDLINEFGFDVTVPTYHSAVYARMHDARARPWGAFNPLSVPSVLATNGLSLQNWEGSENANAPTLERLISLMARPERDVLDAFGFRNLDRGLNRRELLTDLRNLSTLALQQDSYPGLLWADTLYGQTELQATILSEIPRLYAAEPVRKLLNSSAASLVRNSGDRAQIARGRAIFSDRIVGEISNRQVLPQAPEAYASAGLRGPVLAPLDPTRPLLAQIPVRCADCHSGSPLERRDPLRTHPPPLGRCTHCHLAHPPAEPGDEPLVSIRSLGVPERASAELAFCERCHEEHRDFGPLVYSSSRLFPFDADGDGLAQGDEQDDAKAGGIATEPLIQIEIPPTMRSRGIDIPVIRYTSMPGPIAMLHMGVMWVRVAPLIALASSAPYLHNGSVPTLRALLDPATERPVSFVVGANGFVFDTRLPGNRNIGHEYGTRLSKSEKDDLLTFLESL